MKHYLMVFIKGMAMGAADIVPGVSGGTVAFITGIYEELLDSLKKMTPASLAIWYREGFGAFWKHINGFFLLSLFCGILLSILSLANIVTWLLAEHPLLVWGFFYGMVLASTIYIAKPLPFKKPLIIFLFILGATFATGISMVRPAELPGEWWVVFFAGSIAICAMLLPGVSGSFLLILMGLYGFILQSVVEFNFIILACFALGCVIGLLTFSHLLSWLLRSYHDATLALMTGFLLGSLSVIWPWKQVLEVTFNRHGEQIPLRQENVLPDQFFALTGADPQTLPVLGIALFGFVLVFALEYAASIYQRKSGK